MPSRPSSAISGISSVGKRASSNHSAMSGRMRRSTNSRTVARSASSVSLNSLSRSRRSLALTTVLPPSEVPSPSASTLVRTPVRARTLGAASSARFQSLERASFFVDVLASPDDVGGTDAPIDRDRGHRRARAHGDRRGRRRGTPGSDAGRIAARDVPEPAVAASARREAGGELRRSRRHPRDRRRRSLVPLLHVRRDRRATRSTPPEVPSSTCSRPTVRRTWCTGRTRVTSSGRRPPGSTTTRGCGLPRSSIGTAAGSCTSPPPTPPFPAAGPRSVWRRAPPPRDRGPTAVGPSCFRPTTRPARETADGPTTRTWSPWARAPTCTSAATSAASSSAASARTACPRTPPASDASRSRTGTRERTSYATAAGTTSSARRRTAARAP